VRWPRKSVVLACSGLVCLACSVLVDFETVGRPGDVASGRQ
jgi:hypothetical protein